MILYHPNRGRAIVRLLPPETTTESGLHIPSPVNNNRRAVVVEIGDQEYNGASYTVPTMFDVDDTVVLSQFTQGEVVDVSQELVAVRFSEILATVERVEDARDAEEDEE